MTLNQRRLQIYFSKGQYDKIRHRAQAEGKSMGQLVREATQRYLCADESMLVAEGYKSLLTGLGTCTDKRPDTARRHDEHLGEAPW